MHIPVAIHGGVGLAGLLLPIARSRQFKLGNIATLQGEKGKVEHEARLPNGELFEVAPLLYLFLLICLLAGNTLELSLIVLSPILSHLSGNL